MQAVDDVKASRLDFIENRPGNLAFLLRKRYSWMNSFMEDKHEGIEVGCGNGLSKFFISNNYLLTDHADFEWIEKKVDALDMPYEPNSLDFIISSNMIHHLAKPVLFFRECNRVLKPGGSLIIQEINNSFFMRFILRIMKHEGYAYDVNPFNEEDICNDPADLWSGNNAIPNLLFDDKKKFEQHFPFHIIHQKFSEFFIFPLSGGVTAKTKTIQLPLWILKIIDLTDQCLITISRKTFALQQQIVLRKL